MRMITARLRSASPMSQSRQHEEPALDREGKDAYDERTWMHKLHTMPDGEVFIPPMALKQALTDACKMLGLQIPGKGKSTYTKHFEAGVLCMEPIKTGVHKDQVGRDKIQANSDGVRGSGKRVPRRFPRIDSWVGEAQFIVLDDIITLDIFRKHLEVAGTMVGVGRFRPRNGGFYGRFTVESCTEAAS